MALVQGCAAARNLLILSQDAVAAMHVVVAGGRMVINAHVVLLGLESIAAVKVPQLVSEQEQCTPIEGVALP